MSRKGRSAIWRDAVRDSDLDSTAKLVGHTLSTYFDGAARTYGGTRSPSRATLAKGCSLSDRAVDAAIIRLEIAGFLVVEHTSGGNTRTNVYVGLIPQTANDVRRSEWSTAKFAAANGEPHALNGEARSQESAESALKAGAAHLKGAPAHLDYCHGCDEKVPDAELDKRGECGSCRKKRTDAVA